MDNKIRLKSDKAPLIKLKNSIDNINYENKQKQGIGECDANR
jgi:hypothetical protein